LWVKSHETITATEPYTILTIKSSKMRKLSLFLIICTGFITDFTAQEATCGSEEVHQRELNNNQLFQRRMFNLERRLIRDRANGLELRDGEILTVPTVVHIIHEGESVGSGSNISDEQIASAMFALNEDFRKVSGSNGDGDGVDTHLEFCLALRDPNGNSTNGINRVDGSIIPLYAEEGIGIGQGSGADEVDVKSLSAWPKEDYLNIWIVNEIEDNDAGSGIQGFAYFPISSMKDGVTILHNSFGTTGNLKPFTDMNRTTTHEVGHFLGLYHTFHNSTDCAETNCETQGDNVCDTPVTVLNSSCANPECNSTQQVENYLDYTNQVCKNMFTEGQKVRMRYTLTEERSSLLTSNGCVPASDHDAGITAINSPSGSLCNGTLFPEVSLTNFGGETLTSANILYSIDNDAQTSFNWTGSIAPGATELVSLPVISASSGSHTFYANTSAPNGNVDSYSVNDGSQSSFVISSGAVAQVNIKIDYAGSEITWEILDGNQVLSSGGPYSDNNNHAVMSHDVCLSEGCYDFVIYDEYGDGLSFLSGDYEVLNGNGEQVVFGQGDFGSEASHNFCIEAPEGNAPVALFNASNNEICAGSAISFSDNSSETPTSWSWEFQGATPTSSSMQNPNNITYNTPGLYPVTLTVSNNFGSDTETISGFIEVQDAPTVNLTSSNVSCFGANDGAASLTSVGNNSIEWSNGGNAFSLSGLSAGNYSITLTSSAGCSSSSNFNITQPEGLNLTLFKSDVSCHGLADGSITASASGGSAPYSFSWSNGANSNSLSGLNSGIYNLTVTDNNGCSETDNATIVEPSEIILTTSDITAETCTGADGSAVANALGGTGNLTYTWSNEDEGQTLSGVPFGSYSVTTTDATGCTATTELNIPYDCATILPTTQLISSQCNKSGFSLAQNLEINEVEGAEMYLWHFATPTGTLIEEAYTMGNNPTFPISEIEQVTYGDGFSVKIQIQKDQEWGEWGSTCNVNIMDSPLPVNILEADCQLSTVTIGETIQLELNSGADEFEWTITTENSENTYYSYINQITLSEEMDLIAGENFSIKVKALFGDTWTEFSNSCDYTLEIIDNINGIVGLDNLAIGIYPNPNSGRYFSLDIENLPHGNNVIDIMIFSSNGKLIDSWTAEQNGSTHISETYSFNNKLSTGMYLVQVDFAGNNYQQKLIVK